MGRLTPPLLPNTRIYLAALLAPSLTATKTVTFTSKGFLAPEIIRTPIDCILTRWSVWSKCSSTCGVGERKRVRYVKTAAINGGDCAAKKLQTKTCVVPCNSLVTWARSKAPKSRGVPLQLFPTPARVVPAPTPAPTLLPTATVHPVDCILTKWSIWSKCSRFEPQVAELVSFSGRCGVGKSRRVRYVSVQSKGGGKCPAKRVEIKTCAVTCPTPQPTFFPTSRPTPPTPATQAPTPPPTLWTVSTLVNHPAMRNRAKAYLAKVKGQLVDLRKKFQEQAQEAHTAHHRITKGDFIKLTQMQKERDQVQTNLRDMNKYKLVTETAHPTTAPTRIPTTSSHLGALDGDEGDLSSSDWGKSELAGLIPDKWRGAVKTAMPTQTPTVLATKKASKAKVEDIMKQIESVYAMESKLAQKDKIIFNAARDFHLHRTPAPTLRPAPSASTPTFWPTTLQPTSAPTWMGIVAKILAAAAEKKKEIGFPGAAPIEGATAKHYPTPEPSFKAFFDTSLGAHFNRCFDSCYTTTIMTVNAIPTFLKVTSYDPCVFAYQADSDSAQIKFSRQMCRCMLGELLCHKWKQQKRYLSYTRQLPHTYKQLTSADCVGHWGSWSPCNCTDSTKKREFVVDRGAIENGKDCISYPQEMECHCASTKKPSLQHIQVSIAPTAITTAAPSIFHPPETPRFSHLASVAQESARRSREACQEQDWCSHWNIQKTIIQACGVDPQDTLVDHFAKMDFECPCSCAAARSKTPSPTPVRLPTLAPLPGSCTNGKLDATETGIDCGGPDCRACGAGGPCLLDHDCLSNSCQAGICMSSPPTYVPTLPPTHAPKPTPAIQQRDDSDVFSSVFSVPQIQTPTAAKVRVHRLSRMHKMQNWNAPPAMQVDGTNSGLYSRLEHEQEAKWDKGGF